MLFISGKQFVTQHRFRRDVQCIRGVAYDQMEISKSNSR